MPDCDPMNHSTPGLPVHHQLPEFTETHDHWVGDAIQPSHPPSSPSPALILSQHQGPFKWVSSSSQVAKVLEFQLQHQSFQWTPGLISLRMDWLDLLAVQGTLKSLQHHNSKASILLCSAFYIVQPSHPYMTTGKIITLTRRTFVGKVMSLHLNMLSTLVITFLPRSLSLFLSYLFLCIFTVTFLTQTFLSLWLNYHLSSLCFLSFSVFLSSLSHAHHQANHPQTALSQWCCDASRKLLVVRSKLPYSLVLTDSPSPHPALSISFYFPLRGSTHPNFYYLLSPMILAQTHTGPNVTAKSMYLDLLLSLLIHQYSSFIPGYVSFNPPSLFFQLTPNHSAVSLSELWLQMCPSHFSPVSYIRAFLTSVLPEAGNYGWWSLVGLTVSNIELVV